MKTRNGPRLILVLVVAFLALGLVGCTAEDETTTTTVTTPALPPVDTTEGTETGTDEAGASDTTLFDEADLAAFRAEAERRLDQIDDQLQTVEAELEQATGAEREQLQALADDLRDERQAVEDQLAQLNDATQDEQATIRETIEENLDDVEQGLQDLQRELGF